jgi:iron complex outermembrane recepter protein
MRSRAPNFLAHLDCSRSQCRVTVVCVLLALPVMMVDCAKFVEAADTSGALEEIIVTAEKRPETVGKVPISISVFSRDAMEQQNIQNIADVAAISPGVDYQNEGTTSAISIRGISSGIVGYSTTGIYIDDVPVQIRLDGGVIPGTNTTPLVFDLDRVEVLRGPQGTLFGAGAEGGIVRLIQPQPSLTQSSGYARAGLATTDNGDPSYESGVAFGGPIIQDEIGFRVSVWHRRDGGYIDHDSAIPGGAQYNNANWNDSDVLRAALTFAPTESLAITPSLYYQHIFFKDVPTFDPAGSNGPGDTFTHNWSSLNPQYSNVGDGRLVFQGLLLQPSSDQLYLPSLKGLLNLDAVSLTSSTSYLYRRYAAQQDFTTVNPVLVGLPWPVTANAASISYTPSYQNVFVQELRAQSPDSTRSLQWTLGLFYTKSRQENSQLVWSPYWPTQIEAAFGKPILQAFGQNLLPGNYSIYENEPISDTQLATFGQINYRLFNRLNLIAGVRVARETDKYSIYVNGPLNGPNATQFSGEQSQTVVDPKFGINAQLDDNNLLYISAAKGDRIGGVNPPFYNFAACNAALAALGYPNGAPSTYQGDTLWSYEIGSKNRVFGGRLQIEASAFHIKWSDIQQIVQVSACTEGFTSNLGKATSNGFDFQAAALVTDALRLALSLGYTNAKNATTIVSGGNAVVANGQQVNPYSSPWIVVPTAEYDFTIAGDQKGYLRVDDTFHSKNPGPYQPTNNTNSPTYNAFFIPNPAYNQLNAHLGTTWSSWDVSVYALNLLNSHPLLYNQQIQPFTFYGSTFTIRPLTIGFTSIYRW